MDSTATLYDQLLPGTHDSAAYRTRPDLVSRSTFLPLHASPIRHVCTSVQTDFALTQNLSILQQLHAGARFLDIRVSKRPKSSSDSSFWTVHGMVLCVPLSEVLHHINQFHRDTQHSPVTIVTVFRPSLLDLQEELHLATYVTQNIQHDFYRGDDANLRNIPLANLPPNVLAGLRNLSLPVKWGQDPWIDTYCAEKKIAFLRNTLSMTKHRAMRDNLFVLGWTVTPSVFDVIFRVVSLGRLRPSVKTEAVKMNAHFLDFLNQHSNTIIEKVNVIFFDCFTAEHAHLVRSLNSTASESDDSADS